MALSTNPNENHTLWDLGHIMPTESKDHYSEPNKDFDLGGGKYAYIGLTVDLPGNDIGVIRPCDIPTNLRGNGDYIPPYSTYKCQDLNHAEFTKQGSLCVVMYNSKAVRVPKNGVVAATAKSDSAVTIIPMAKFANSDPQALLSIYDHQVSLGGKLKPGQNSVSDRSIFPTNLAPKKFGVIDQELKQYLSKSDVSKKDLSSGQVLAAATNAANYVPKIPSIEALLKQVQEEKEPKFYPKAVSYKPTEAERMVQYKAGYTRIGYAALMLPPEQIVYTREQPLETKQLMRASGSNKQGYGHSSKQFQFQLHMCDPIEINTVLLPIIRQFQKTPFVPVINELLNDTYDIQALTLEAIQIATTPGFPDQLDVVLQVSEFNWRAYMPGELDFDSTICYPLFKLWCENVKTTHTRPIGWVNDESDIPVPRSQAMSGLFEMYLPDETYLREMEDLAKHAYNQDVLFTMMGADADNIKRIKSFAAGDEKMAGDYGPGTTSDRLDRDLVLYNNLRIAYSDYEGSTSDACLESEYKVPDAFGTQNWYLVNGKAAAIRLRNREFAQKLLTVVAKTVSDGKPVTMSGADAMGGDYGGVMPNATITVGTNPFASGVFVTPKLDGSPVRQTGGSGGVYSITGLARDEGHMSALCNNKIQSVVSGAGGQDGKDVDKILSESYFIIPAGAVSILDPLIQTYNKESDRIMAERRKSAENDMPAESLANDTKLINNALLKENGKKDIACWNKYLIPSFTIEQISAGGENLIAALMPQMQDSPVHQFLGRADCHVVVKGTVTDQEDIALLRRLLDQEEYLTRRYSGLHMANPYGGYMLVKNEICQLMGITHVLPAKCEVTTSKEFPGTFDVEIVFTQFNPMQQRSEELAELTKDINWYIGEDKTIESGDSVKPQTTSDDYFSHLLRAEYFNKKLRSMELYPDMSLLSFNTLRNWYDRLGGDDKVSRTLLFHELGVDPSHFTWTAKDCAGGKLGAFDNWTKQEDRLNASAPVYMGFVDPDFYCAPSFPNGKEFVEGVLGTLGATGTPEQLSSTWMTQHEQKPANMKIRDRRGSSSGLPFNGELAEPTGTYDEIDKKYADVALLLPVRDAKTGAIKGYDSIAPTDLKKKLQAMGFTPKHLAAIDEYCASLGIPAALGYYIFSIEGGAGKQKHDLNSKYSFGCGQMQAIAVEGINETLAKQKGLSAKNPWGATYRFSRQDRADYQKAIWMSLANYWFKYQCITKAEGNSGRKPDSNVCWALAQYAYVKPSMINTISASNSVTQIYNKLPPAYSGNPIRSRVQGAYALVSQVDPADITNTPEQNHYNSSTPGWVNDLLKGPDATKVSKVAPKIAPASLFGLTDTPKFKLSKPEASSKPEPKALTATDGRANYSLIIATNGDSNTDSPLTQMNVYGPVIKINEEVGNSVGAEVGTLVFDEQTDYGAKSHKLTFKHGYPGTYPGGEFDKLDHLVDPNDPEKHYYLVRGGTECNSNKSSYGDWLGYMKTHSITAADFMFLSGDPNGKLLWDDAGNTITKSTVDGRGQLQVSNIPNLPYGSIGAGPTTYKVKEMFLREDGNDMFHDVREYSGHGRLVQAFPSYCILLVDGGRWMRYWRLYDHLFGMTAVESIEIFKSRKTPTDVATVTFANMYGHLTRQPAESPGGKLYTWSLPMVVGAIQDSIIQNFRPEDITRWRQHADSLLLKPGARMHIRMGYGSNANNIPVMFNGVISEVTPGKDSVQVVGLGDGIELEKKLQPNDQLNGQNVYKVHGLLGAATTPRETMLGILAPTKFIELVTCGGYDHNNPHGIEHFGSPTYTFLNKDANEVGMNIYEASTNAVQEDGAVIGSNAWEGAMKGLNLIPGYGMIDGTYSNFIFGVSIEDATAWDVFTTCRRAIPEYICAVHPFGLRSTLFFGKPHWPLRYDYDTSIVQLSTTNSADQACFVKNAVKDEDGFVKVDGWSKDGEWPLDKITNWKAFSQVHVITSTYNLISNQIKASDEDVFTICQAVGSSNGIFKADGQNNDWSSKVFLDTDIYPEFQKTLYVKSGLYSTDLMQISDMIRDLKPSDLIFTRKVSDTSAVNCLKESVMDMYKGHAVIVGDPSIKPHDRIFFADTRSEMSGLFPVKEVTHHLSFETGMISTVSPDLLASVTEFSDQMCWSWQNQFGQRFAGSLGMQYMIGAVAAKKVNPFFIMDKLLKRINDLSQKSPEITEARILMDSIIKEVRVAASNGIGNISDEIFTSPTLTNEIDSIIKSIAKTITIDGKAVQTTEEIGRVGKVLSTSQGLLGKATKTLGEKLVSFRDAYKIEEDAARIGYTLRNALLKDTFAATAAELKYGTESLEIIKLLGKRGGIATTAAKVGKLCVWMLAVDCLSEWVNRHLAYRQSLVLNPLRIAGKEFTAGINGHIGCVAGDPDGYWDGVIQSLTNWGYSNKNHDKGSLYNFDMHQPKAAEAFGDVAFGLANIVSWAAGIQPAEYSNLSDEHMDQYVLGGNTYSTPERDEHLKRIAEHAKRLNMGGELVIGSSDEVVGFNGAGTSALLDNSDSAYGPKQCNRYAYDVMQKNGLDIPARSRFGETGGGDGSISIQSIFDKRKYWQPGTDKVTEWDKLLPGMLVHLGPMSKQHWGIVTSDYTLNENSMGKVRNTRKLDDLKKIHTLIGGVMPNYNVNL